MSLLMKCAEGSVRVPYAGRSLYYLLFLQPRRLMKYFRKY